MNTIDSMDTRGSLDLTGHGQGDEPPLQGALGRGQCVPPEPDQHRQARRPGFCTPEGGMHDMTGGIYVCIYYIPKYIYIPLRTCCAVLVTKFVNTAVLCM